VGGLGLGGLLLGLLAVLDDVALLKEDSLGDLPPQRRAAEQELEVHAEMLELLALGVAHDCAGLAVGLDGHSLLVPADRLGLLGQRCAEAGEGPGLVGKLCGGLVVLVESHALILSRARPLALARALTTLRCSGPDERK